MPTGVRQIPLARTATVQDLLTLLQSLVPNTFVGELARLPVIAATPATTTGPQGPLRTRRSFPHPSSHLRVVGRTVPLRRSPRTKPGVPIQPGKLPWVNRPLALTLVIHVGSYGSVINTRGQGAPDALQEHSPPEARLAILDGWMVLVHGLPIPTTGTGQVGQRHGRTPSPDGGHK